MGNAQIREARHEARLERIAMRAEETPEERQARVSHALDATMGIFESLMALAAPSLALGLEHAAQDDAPAEPVSLPGHQ